jgi:hypothetical protein
MLKILEKHPAGKAVPAISLRQPWAAAVALLGKDVENRDSWPYDYRGPIVIHAASDEPGLEDFEELRILAAADGAHEEDLAMMDPSNDEFAAQVFGGGVIVAVANLAAVFGPKDDVPEDHPAVGSPWGEDDAAYWLYFEDVVAVEPLPFEGRAGMFEVPWSVVERLKGVPEAES